MPLFHSFLFLFDRRTGGGDGGGGVVERECKRVERVRAASPEGTSKPLRSLGEVDSSGIRRNDTRATAVVTAADSNAGAARAYERQGLLQLHAPRALAIDRIRGAQQERKRNVCSGGQEQQKNCRSSKANSAAGSDSVGRVCGRGEDKGQAAAAHIGV